jgi:TetR/AcrR family transcriptional regulator, transcriptional repressor for nem operon
MTTRNLIPELPETKRKLVDAGMTLMRARGYNATSVDEICSAAGVTKGGFFHYFKSKDELAQAALARFYDGKAQDFAEAPFRKLVDPLDRVYGRLDYAKKAVGGPAQLTKGCLIGVFAQELAFTNPEMRSACQAALLRTAGDLEKDLVEAKSLYAPKADFDPKKLALFYVSLVQGGLVVAKAAESNAVLMDNLENFRTYLQSLFGQPKKSRQKISAD